MKKVLLFLACTSYGMVLTMNDDSLVYEGIHPDTASVICQNGAEHIKFLREKIDSKKTLIELITGEYNVQQIQVHYSQDPKKEGFEKYNSFWKTIYEAKK